MPAVAYDPDPVAPLWRAAQVFRLLSVIYALGFHIAINGDLRRPGLGWVLFAALTAWSIACGVAYLKGFGRTPRWVIAEFAVVVLLMLSTRVVATQQWTLDNQSWPTTLWATNAAISAAILAGPAFGMLGGLAVAVTSTVVKGSVNLNLGRNAAVVVEIAVGLAIGMAAVTARRSHAEAQRATLLTAKVEERERLSRQVHDGVIQVLALVARRGREIGGPTAELAELAGVQERALRHLVSAADLDVDTDAAAAAMVDVAERLRSRESDRVSVSLPADRVMLEANAAAELEAAVVNALDNVVSHAGAEAKAFVLLEDLGESVTVSIRDDGVGITAGRLEEAADQGRIGITKSIVGRMTWLGGSAELHTVPGAGTEWELSLPRQGRRDG